MQPKFLFAAALCLADLAPAQALAQAWPDKPIAIIVPFPAGGSTDGVMRFIAPKLAERLGQPVVVENIGGAGGAIGANRVAHATADGSTLLAGSINDVVLQPRINPRLGYGSDSFEPIAMVSTSPLLLVARKDLPQENIDAVVAALKRAPGSLSFGSPGQGTFQHVVMEDLQRRTQTRMLHVPYRGRRR
ncbi:tripartite tricarboxylate transporter substrate binding protein [Achromobacter insuavis]